MEKPDFPYISAELAKYLEQTYPERCPDINQTDRSIWMYAGMRDIARLLIQRHKEQLGTAD